MARERHQARHVRDNRRGVAKGWRVRGCHRLPPMIWIPLTRREAKPSQVLGFRKSAAERWSSSESRGERSLATGSRESRLKGAHGRRKGSARAARERSRSSRVAGRQRDATGGRPHQTRGFPPDAVARRERSLRSPDAPVQTRHMTTQTASARGVVLGCCDVSACPQNTQSICKVNTNPVQTRYTLW